MAPIHNHINISVKFLHILVLLSIALISITHCATIMSTTTYEYIDVTIYTENMTFFNTTSVIPFYPSSQTVSIYVIVMLAVLVFLALILLGVYLCHKGEAYRRN